MPKAFNESNVLKQLSFLTTLMLYTINGKDMKMFGGKIILHLFLASDRCGQKVSLCE